MPLFGKQSGRGRGSSPFDVWFWVFLLGSIALGSFLIQEAWGEWKASRWPRVPCEILTSEVEQYTGGGGKVYYRAHIRYRYEFGGRSHTSEQVRAKGTSRSSEYVANERLVVRFPVGMKTECHVNPRNPDDAVLDSRRDYFLPFIAIGPMLIWAVYQHVAIGEWLARLRARKPGRRLPLTELRTTRRWVRNFLVGVAGGWMSGAGIVFLLAYPWWRATRASDWPPAPCRIVQSRVKTEMQHQGWSFKAEIAFSYTVAGREHVSEKLDFSQDFGTSYAETEASLAGFTAGTTNVCYFNPANPEDAVLRRTFRVNGFLTLFVLAWFGGSCFLVTNGLLIRLRRVQSVLPWETAKGRALAAKPLVNLEPAQNAILMFGLCAAGGLVCAVLAVWLGRGVIRSLSRGGFDLLPACYAAVSLVGIQQALRHGRRFLRDMRNPSPKLAVRPAVLVPGQKFSVAWVWRHGAKFARPFRLWLEGREEAYVLKTTFTPHGETKDEKLEKVRFAQRLLAELPDEPSGTRQFHLPVDLMSSFEGVRVRLVWLLRVEVTTPDGASHHEHKIIIRTPAA